MSTKFMQYIRPQLGEELRRIRQEQNLSTTEVALRDRFTLETIEQIENGKNIRFGYYDGPSQFYDKTLKLRLE